MSKLEGQLMNQPPFFDGSNYMYWKARMKIFLRALDEAVWQAVVKGRSIPMFVDINGRTTSREKDYRSWDNEEKSQAMADARALNAIFCAVSSNEFRRIYRCETAKQAWDILEITHEGTPLLKKNKLQILTTQLENLHMEENETFMEFYDKLNHILNMMWGLGEKVPDEKICRKILRSLPERFTPKVTSFEDTRDIDTTKVEELVGNLQSYELLFRSSKKKSIALQPTWVEYVPDDEIKKKSIALQPTWVE